MIRGNQSDCETRRIEPSSRPDILVLAHLIKLVHREYHLSDV